MKKLKTVLHQISELLAELNNRLSYSDSLLNEPNIDPTNYIAYRWQRDGGRAGLSPITSVHLISLEDLHGIDRQKDLITQNTQQFVAGLPANNVLLWGARGTGKSSLVKAMLSQFSANGLRMIEIDKHDLVDLSTVVEQLREQPYKFVLFCDDLSFESGERGYTSLKAALDGSLYAAANNVLIYATSNRRHLMPEYMQDNISTEYKGDEVHPSEAVEERISLSDRFGLWISFYAFDQNQYLNIVRHWLRHYNVYRDKDGTWQEFALRWALQRGTRSGRTAYQFARDWAGRHAKI